MTTKYLVFPERISHKYQKILYTRKIKRINFFHTDLCEHTKYTLSSYISFKLLISRLKKIFPFLKVKIKYVIIHLRDSNHRIGFLSELIRCVFVSLLLSTISDLKKCCLFQFSFSKVAHFLMDIIQSDLRNYERNYY